MRRLYRRLETIRSEESVLQPESLAERNGCRECTGHHLRKESDEILKKLSLKSSEGGFKITILWLPEKMHPVCANKLLKLLEEPPEKTIFLLVSEAPEMILPTILSRTQRMNVRK